MKMITIAEAARQANVSRGRILRAIDEGDLRPLKLGNRQVVNQNEVQLAARKWDRSGIGIEALSSETGLSVGAIRQAIRDGWMPYKRDGKAYRFDVNEVSTAIEKRITEQMSE